MKNFFSISILNFLDYIYLLFPLRYDEFHLIYIEFGYVFINASFLNSVIHFTDESCVYLILFICVSIVLSFFHPYLLFRCWSCLISATG